MRDITNSKYIICSGPRPVRGRSAHFVLSPTSRTLSKVYPFRINLVLVIKFERSLQISHHSGGCEDKWANQIWERAVGLPAPAASYFDPTNGAEESAPEERTSMTYQ